MRKILSNYLLWTDNHSPGCPTIAHWCPACKNLHHFACDQPFRNGAKWSFDHNLEQPSFSPSMNIRVGPWPKNSPDEIDRIEVCHYFLADGKIQFLSDCTHSFSGQTIDLPVIPYHIIQTVSTL